jgi:hypothetical protein
MDVGAPNGASNNGGIAHSPVVRCILWHARGSILPGALIGALDRPSIQWKAWDCDLLTLAELFRPSIAPDTLTHDARAKVVLLVDPARLAGLNLALDTIERYRPATPLWIYESGDSPRLVGMTLPEVRALVRPKSTPGATPEPAIAHAPTLQIVTRPVGPIVPKPISAPKADHRRSESPSALRLADGYDAPPRIADQGHEPEGEADSDPLPAEPASTLLSEAEIEMLLSDPPKPHGGSGSGSSKRGGHVR